ncbi:nitrogen metabolic regulation protein [Pyrenophora tritici-repentis Pt-1C-BFP]|nr:nitrogen metabolic regulation protein [Pyrenophora tritici-repentis Pt-1C-BFP]EDU42607.1 nitrogen metabolic regulation protein [Pyrenophora tritici-repentis Pt-1C-BFP]
MINVPTPTGYREHLSALEYTLGEKGAPYFGPDLEPDVPSVSLELWEGNRSMEEYAQEVFPVEEAANGLTWMEEGEIFQHPNVVLGLSEQLNQARL